ncbi:helix-turn-helix domain-containing protein [Paenibacillus spiritus]|uniref:Helix-turn-helix domain-containing protein n=1 Tax=Paenibacillus spiritus TaxID=2496557 RepID=A0A5J5GGU2_9BACL|nr:helix-turn-helix domain-containing protein [Paenibacillus spiritus]KAA9007365.1 helix-turn-helix domain-containing protein [Paenibacillus spiritus]
MSKVRWVHIKNETIRDPSITANDFCLLVYLKWFSFNGKERTEFDIDNGHAKFYTGIKDNKTIKKSYLSLYEHGYICIPVHDHIIQSRALQIKLNNAKLHSESGFTRLPSTLLYMIRDSALSQQELRILYYLESRINRPTKAFCYPSRELICSELGIKSPKTISTAKKSLVSRGLLKVEEHKIGTTLQYDEEDRLIRTKFNNHYYVQIDKMLEYYG